MTTIATAPSDYPDEPTNDQRAEWAAIAACAFARETSQLSPTDPDPAIGGTDAEVWTEIVEDLLCDLQHLADRTGISWTDVLASAEGHHEYERDAETPWARSFDDEPAD